ncbi:spinster family MFS transporter [Kordiimonas pumila]|uniref:Spinster family MFS transporter n=1 Tax=Kordiimonas pumila TaxID=2161677 RepID=A0ABV7D858_9PROT|nr:MFS transporter [Kordiimonas pumila]
MNKKTEAGSRNWALFLLFSVSVLNLFDRHVINILAQDIKTDLDITDTELGLLTGTAFGIFYSILGIPLGRLADRVNRVRLISAALMLWSCFTALSGFAVNFTQLFLARMGVGVGEAGSHPASTTLVPDFFPEKTRGTAMSILLLGAPIGSFLGMFLGGMAGAAWGWRAAFIAAGIPGIILAVIILLTLRDPRAVSGTRPEPPSLKASLLVLWQTQHLRFLAVFLACATFTVYAGGAWLPAFFIRVHGIATAEIGIYTGFAIGLGGGIGVLGGGFICDYFRAKVKYVEFKVLFGATILCIPCLLVTLFTAHFMLAVVAMFAFNICVFAYLSPAVTLIQREAPAEVRALAVAISVSIANISSLTFGLPFVGFMSDKFAPTVGVFSIAYALSVSILLVTFFGLTFLYMSFEKNKHSDALS